MDYQVTVVIPTYNRIDQLSMVIDHLLKCEAEKFSKVEIIVVDDGSSKSPEAMLLGKSIAQPFVIKYERQENAGPAKARNNGYRKAMCSTVLFLDDDILCSPDLLVRHVEAHRSKPSSVITGPYICVQPAVPIPSSRYVSELERSVNLSVSDDDEFVELHTVNSGNLSIEREMFLGDNGLYDDSLKSPTAEEYDVIAKLKRRGIPVYSAKNLAAIHLQPTTIEETCKREYKHAIGIGELAVKMPELANELSEIKTFLDVNGKVASSDPAGMKAKKRLKSIFSGTGLRNLLLQFVKTTEKILPFDSIMFPLFRIVIGINLYAGVNDGKRKFEGSRAW
jgi:glycosyltransferase involved in cell wall biosynthesis